MNFLQIAFKYILSDANDTEETLLTFDDTSDNAIIVNWEIECSQAVFDYDAPIVFNDSDGSITVKDREGDEYTFVAFMRQEVIISDNPRAINLTDARIESTEPNRIWVKVGKFDVLLNHTDEGIVVDVWPWVEANAPILPDNPLATCYAFDTDADEALEHEIE